MASPATLMAELKALLGAGSTVAPAGPGATFGPAYPGPQRSRLSPGANALG